MTNALSKLVTFLSDAMSTGTQLLLRFCGGKMECVKPTWADKIAERRRESARLFRDNKRSDEYYTRGSTWHRFLDAKGLLGGTFWEPFFGDGTSRDALAGLVTIVGKPGDFWEHVLEPDRPKHMILSNPPFSFKWLILETLCELKQDFALILPWQSFYQDGFKKMDALKKRHGGDWEFFKLNKEEQFFWSPAKNAMAGVGCKILHVRF